MRLTQPGNGSAELQPLLGPASQREREGHLLADPEHLPRRLPDGSIRCLCRAEGPDGIVGDGIVNEPRGTEHWQRLDEYLRGPEGR